MHIDNIKFYKNLPFSDEGVEVYSFDNVRGVDFFDDCVEIYFNDESICTRLDFDGFDYFIMRGLIDDRII